MERFFYLFIFQQYAFYLAFLFSRPNYAFLSCAHSYLEFNITPLFFGKSKLLYVSRIKMVDDDNAGCLKQPLRTIIKSDDVDTPLLILVTKKSLIFDKISFKVPTDLLTWIKIRHSRAHNSRHYFKDVTHLSPKSMKFVLSILRHDNDEFDSRNHKNYFIGINKKKDNHLMLSMIYCSRFT